MKKTAIEWLQYQFHKDNLSKEFAKVFNSSFEQAKEMEKQQIIDARVNGFAEGIDICGNPLTEDISKNHEIYYNETFKNK
jgi:hypothetical protein